MPRDDYKTCRKCGRHSDEAGDLSHTRLCAVCWQKRFEENLDAMKTMRGPFAKHWRVQMARSVGFGPLDDVQAKP